MIPFLIRYWKYIAGGLAVIGLLWLHSHWTSNAYNRAFNAGWQVEHARLEKLQADYRMAYERGRADNIADVRAKESDAAAITEKANHDLESQLADARRLAADYARRMREASAANPGGPGESGLSPATSAPGGPFGAGMSVIPEHDLRICVENTVKVKGWQDFYASLRERYNTDGTR